MYVRQFRQENTRIGVALIFGRRMNTQDVCEATCHDVSGESEPAKMLLLYKSVNISKSKRKMCLQIQICCREKSNFKIRFPLIF